MDNIVYRSLWELRFMKWCDMNPSIIEWGSETVIVPYISPIDKKVHRYFVDFYIKVKNKNGAIQKSLPEDTKYFSFIHPSSILLNRNIVIGEGSFIGANCVITTNVKIGNHAILNRNVNIGHDVVIGDCFSAMAGSVVSGSVLIGDNCYMGNNSSIREKITICDDVIIGMNGSVVKDIDKPGTYVGVPVNKIK